jgi:general secretion pathway protein F
MPNFRYRAMTRSGEIVSGLITAPSMAEVAYRIDYLRLVPIDKIVEEGEARASRLKLRFESRARGEDVTIFTYDLAQLLRSGAQLDRALELLAADSDIGRLRSIVGAIRISILSGETFADALSHHPSLFPSMYVALVRVGEASGTLEKILQVLANDRSRAEAVRRKISDALRYPAFLLFTAACVLTFFMMFVLPQFGAVLHDLGAKIDPIAGIFLRLSEFMTSHSNLLGFIATIVLAGGLLLSRLTAMRVAVISRLARLPLIRSILELHWTALFCRNLAVLLGAAVPLTTTLQILANIMATSGDVTNWAAIADRVRHGSKLSDAIEQMGGLPGMAVRMLRLGEETGQLPILAGRVAEFYESRLQRSLDRIVGIVGPAAVITISVIVGGLIVSVMTALLSVSQSVG